MSFPDPHHPWDPPEDEMRRVDWRDLDLPPGHPGSDDAVAQVLADKPAHWLAYWEGRFANCEGAPSTFVPSRMSHDAIREINARAHVMNELVDDAVARVLACVAARGWSEQTDVFFTTDHGELQGDFGLVYKGPFHTDALMRLPFVWAPAPDGRDRTRGARRPGRPARPRPDLLCDRRRRAAERHRRRAHFPTTPGSGGERVICEWDSILPGYGMHMRSMYRDGWLVTAYEPSTIGTPNGFEEFLERVPVGLARSLDLHSTPIGPRTTIEYDGREGELYQLDEDPVAFVNRWDDPDYRDDARRPRRRPARVAPRRDHAIPRPRVRVVRGVRGDPPGRPVRRARPVPVGIPPECRTRTDTETAPATRTGTAPGPPPHC